MATQRTLLIGIGNHSRGDDGLGWALLDAVALLCPPEYSLEYRYQLMLEDAELLSRFDRVLLADASAAPMPGGAALERCVSRAGAHISTHRADPAALLYLCETLYDCRPDAWLLAMQGFSWELGDGLSTEAEASLRRGCALAAGWVKGMMNDE